MADTTIKISSIQFRCAFTAGYRPTQLAEAEPFVQYADRVLIFGGRDGQGRVEVPFDRGTGGGGGSGPASTDALPEGTQNLYFTTARARASISVGGALTYNTTTGQVSYTPPTLAAVATSGAYSDLTGRPALATVALTGSYTDLANRPALASVATSGLYGDLTGKPSFAAVATSGSASDLGTGTLPAARLPSSGVTAGSYGSGSQIPVITTDGYGRITSITTAANAGSGGGGASGTVTPSGTFAAGDVVGANTTDGNSIKSLGQPGPLVRGLLSGTAGIAFNASTGAFSLAAPTTSVLGGVLAATAGANQFQTGVNTSGAPIFAQPSFGNLSGSATAAQMPAFSGDATSVTGSTALTLAASGVTAGTYTAATVTVDAKGRVTGASNGPVAKQTVTFSCVGKPAAGEVLGVYVAEVPFTVPANFANTAARSISAATASASAAITRIPAGSTTETTIGTLTWAAGATVATFSTQAAVAFAVGDIMRCIAPSTQDSTLADFGVSIYGAR